LPSIRRHKRGTGVPWLWGPDFCPRTVENPGESQRNIDEGWRDVKRFTFAYRNPGYLSP
jgi:hypothetical protein